jgi:hypothetical protein
LIFLIFNRQLEQMADLTQVIQALQYGPLFDMMDRRTGAALLFVNKPISKMVSTYVNATGGFSPNAFEPHLHYCIIRFKDTIIQIPVESNCMDYIKCVFTITNSEYGLPSYAVHIYNRDSTIAETIGLDKESYNDIKSSYNAYDKKFMDFEKRVI